MDQFIDALVLLCVFGYTVGLAMHTVVIVYNSTPDSNLTTILTAKGLLLALFFGFIFGKVSCSDEIKKNMAMLGLCCGGIACFMEIMFLAMGPTGGALAIAGSVMCLVCSLGVTIDGVVVTFYDFSTAVTTQPPVAVRAPRSRTRNKSSTSKYGSTGQTASSDVPIPAANGATSGADPPGSGPVLPLPDCKQSEPPRAADGAGGQLKQAQDLLTPQQGQCNVVIEQEEAKASG